MRVISGLQIMGLAFGMVVAGCEGGTPPTPAPVATPAPDESAKATIATSPSGATATPVTSPALAAAPASQPAQATPSPSTRASSSPGAVPTSTSSTSPSLTAPSPSPAAVPETSPSPSPVASPGPRPGATYRGTASVGGRVLLRLGVKEVRGFAIEWPPGACTFSVSFGDVPPRTAAHGVLIGSQNVKPTPITNNAFRWDLNGRMVVDGSFPSSTEAVGTFDFGALAAPGLVSESCMRISWAATVEESR